MKEFNYIVTDAEGLHARPAGILAKQAAGYASTVKLTRVSNGKTVNAKGVFGIMGLGVKQNEEVLVQVEGADEDTAIAELEAFFKDNL